MKLENNSFRKSASDLRIDPSERVWNRLEKRLDQDQDKIKFSTLRSWMGIAAGILIIFTLFSLFIIEKSHRKPFIVQDLEPLPEGAFVSYQYASQLNEIYERMTWVNFSEGNRKRLKSQPTDALPNGDRSSKNRNGKNL